jgi:outer membrane protein OmpA-like peptidoglycan-associated protein
MVKRYGSKVMKESGSWLNFDTLNILQGDAMGKLFYDENCIDLDTGCTGYLWTRLINPMEVGEVYQISMWVFTPINPAADTAAYSHFGVYVSRDVDIPEHRSLIKSDYYFSGKIIPGQWNKLVWNIRALCTMQYIIVGFFEDYYFPKVERWIFNPVAIYVDQVVVEKLHENAITADIHPTPYCEYYEKEHKQHVLNSITSLDLRFESNSSTLDASDQLELDSFYQANLERNDKIYVIIGHTDSETAENIILSKSRAESVSSYLNEKYKINKQSMLTFGLGSAYPIADNATITGRVLNRRTTIRTSDLTIPQLFYRKGLEYLQNDSLGKANTQFARWIKMVPMAKRIEMVVDPRLLKLKRSMYWKALVMEVRKGYNLYPDSKGAFFLDSMYFEDQKYRTYSPYALNGYIKEIDTLVLPEFKFSIQQAFQKDSLNYLAIKQYLDKNGYPEISKVGRRQSKAVGYIILHNGDSLTYKKYIPVIKNLCVEGEAEWDVFADMTDKLCVTRGEPQVYGTQYDKDSNGRITLYTIDDIEKVNYRRMRIGLGATVVPE